MKKQWWHTTADVVLVLFKLKIYVHMTAEGESNIILKGNHEEGLLDLKNKLASEFGSLEVLNRYTASRF